MRTVYNTYGPVDLSTIQNSVVVGTPYGLCERCNRSVEETHILAGYDSGQIRRFHPNCAFSYFGYRQGE